MVGEMKVAKSHDGMGRVEHQAATGGICREDRPLKPKGRAPAKARAAPSLLRGAREECISPGTLSPGAARKKQVPHAVPRSARTGSGRHRERRDAAGTRAFPAFLDVRVMEIGRRGFRLRIGLTAVLVDPRDRNRRT